MDSLAVFCYIYGLILVTTQAAEINFTFVQVDGGNFMTCDFSFPTGYIALESLRVVRVSQISQREEHIVGLSVIKGDAWEIYPSQDSYQDREVDFKYYLTIYPSKSITSIGLIVSSSHDGGNQNDYKISCHAVYSDLKVITTNSRVLTFKGAAPEKEDSQTMSASEIVLIVLAVVMIVLLTVVLWVFCVLQDDKLKKMTAEKKRKEMELARLKGEQEGGPADPSDLSLQQPAAASTPNTEADLAAATTPNTEADLDAAPSPGTVHCCIIYCN